MDKIVRYLSLGLTLGSAIKITAVGATWPGIAALGILALVSLVLHGVSDQYEREMLKKEIDELSEKLESVDDNSKKNTSALSALKINQGITTRRL